MWLHYSIFQPLLNSFSPSRIFFQEIAIIICRDDYTTAFSSVLHYEPTTGTQTLCSTTEVQTPFLYKDIMLYMTTVTGLLPSPCLTNKTMMYRVAQKERIFLKWVVVRRVSFFGVTSNQKSTFENLVQSTIWKFQFAKKLQLCDKKCW